MNLSIFSLKSIFNLKRAWKQAASDSGRRQPGDQAELTGFPDVYVYGINMKGIQEFEEDEILFEASLIERKIVPVP